MILAQALGEYGLVHALQEATLMARVRVEEMLRHPEPLYYGIAALAVGMLWFFKTRRS